MRFLANCLCRIVQRVWAGRVVEVPGRMLQLAVPMQLAGAAGADWIDPDFSTKSAADAAASCLACRGYMWANQHPAPSKFRPLRAPIASVAARGAAQNRAELTERAASARDAIEPAAQLSVQLVPYARVLVAQYPHHHVRQMLPMQWQKLWQGRLVAEHGGGTQSQAASVAEDVTLQAVVEDEIET